jgi:glucose-6-phosphate 1-epimerase
LYACATERDCTEGLHGGVPVIFPQFAGRGAGPFHGIAKDLPWQLRETQAPGVAVLELGLGGMPWWNHDAALTLRVTLDRATLTLALTVQNRGEQALPFQAGLHTFLAVSGQPEIRGVEHLSYVDHPAPEDRPAPPVGKPLVARAPLDRIFPAAPEITLVRPDSALAIAQHGFANTVVWRPLDPSAATPGDGPPFLCIEPAQLADLQLAPGASWTGTQTLTWLPAASA